MSFDLRGDQTHVVVGVCLPSAAFLFFFYARDHHGTELPALLSCAAVVGGVFPTQLRVLERNYPSVAETHVVLAQLVCVLHHALLEALSTKWRLMLLQYHLYIQ